MNRQSQAALGAVMAMLALVLTMQAPAALAAPDPQQARTRVEDVTTRMLEVLRAEAGDGQADVQNLRQKLDEIVAPSLDFVTMTKLAIGRHWRQASDDQKRTLVTEFRELLLRTYAHALSEYDDQELKVLPLRQSPYEDRVKVRSRVLQENGPEIPVDYSLHYDDGEWLVYDIVVDGISLVTNYRSTFANEIRNAGIEGLIETLEQKNANNATLRADT